MAEASHLLGLPLKHVKKDIRDLLNEDFVPTIDGLFLGSDTKRWDGSKLINLPLSPPSAHALSGIYHTGTLGDAQAPQFVLLDGSRTMTGALLINAYCRPTNLQAYSGDMNIRTLGQGVVNFYGGASVAAQLIQSSGSIGIFRATQVKLLSESLLYLGVYGSGTLPAASASYKGAMAYVDNGPGNADDLMICIKSKTNAWNWKVIISG